MGICNVLFRAKQGLYLGSRVIYYGFWVYLSRASKFSSLLSSVTQVTSPCVTKSKESCWLPDGHAGPTNSTVRLDCGYQVNQCLHGQK